MKLILEDKINEVSSRIIIEFDKYDDNVKKILIDLNVIQIENRVVKSK